MDKVSQSSVDAACVGGGVWCFVIGYSARSLAEALRDAGLRVIAVDAFGDKDLLESAKVPQILGSWGAPGAEKTLQTNLWPFYRELPSSTKTAGLPAFMAGGCENWPELLAYLDCCPEFRLLANHSQISALRRPELWQAACRGTEIDFPTTHYFGQSIEKSRCQASVCSEPPRRWLLKRRLGAGGLGVRRWEADSQWDAGSYLQEAKIGRTLGASLMFDPTGPAQPIFVGATESWRPKDWPAATEFIYRGSFGPIELQAKQIRSIVKLASNLHQQVTDTDGKCPRSLCVGESNGLRLKGWLQFDLIEENEKLWLLEVNPRWTAGMEVLHLSGAANMAALHAQMHGIELGPKTPRGKTTTDGLNCDQLICDRPAVELDIATPRYWIGKAIYYAPQPIHLTCKILNDLHGLVGQGFHDIPSDQLLDATIEAGHPVLTITARLCREGLDESNARRSILDRLLEKRTTIDRLIGIRPH